MISPETLRRYPYFAGISEDSLKQIAMIAEEKTVSAGTRMFNEGDPANCFFLIIDGEVNIDYLLGSGEVRTVDTLTSGDLLVWSALVEPYRTTAMGTATKDCQLICINGEKLREFCEKDPLVGYRLTTQVAKMLANRLEGARVQLAAVD
jgi:CRP-like cAMP-binding protein